jgi:hypothetical protein
MRLLAPLFLSLTFLVTAASSPAGGPLAPIDLSGPFGTRSPWRFTATQGADIPDPFGEAEDKAPGAIRLCVSNDGGRTCRPDLGNLLALPSARDSYAEPHFLNDARIVQPDAHRKLLLLQVASLHGGNGDQRVATAVLAYDRAADGFVTVYRKQTGRNNNQEIRYIADGPLQGAMISAEPTKDAPFGFWVTVSKLAGADYSQVLKYRSATRYGDGNSLAVIDSEMPNIQQRLGLWHPSAKLPLPHGPCRNPRLVRGALWC